MPPPLRRAAPRRAQPCRLLAHPRGAAPTVPTPVQHLHRRTRRDHESTWLVR